MKKPRYNPGGYWTERLAQQFNLQGVGFKEFSTNYNYWLYQAKKNALDKVITDLFKNPYNLTVCDIGCGTGFFSDYCKTLGVKKYYGLDIAKISIDTLQIKYPDYEFQCLEFGNAYFNRHEFDLVVALDVFYHIVNKVYFEKAITNVVKLLVPGGFFLCTDLFSEKDRYTSEHAYHRSKNFWNKILIRNGMKIKELVPLYFFLNRPIGSESPLMRKGLYTIGRNFPKLFYILDKILTRLPLPNTNTKMAVIEKK